MSTTSSDDTGKVEGPEIDTPSETTPTSTPDPKPSPDLVSRHDELTNTSLTSQVPSDETEHGWSWERLWPTSDLQRLQAAEFQTPTQHEAASNSFGDRDLLENEVMPDHDNEDEEQEEGQNEDQDQLRPAPDAMEIDQASMALIQQMLNDELDAFIVPSPQQNVPPPQAANPAAPALSAAGDAQVPADGDAQDDNDGDSDSDDKSEGDDNQQPALDHNDPTAHFIMVNRADVNHESIACPACESVVQDNELVYLTCGHVWCADCLNNNLQAALSNRTVFPPRCCNATPNGIDMIVVEGYLEDDVLIRYLKVGEEYASPDPTFCADVKCGVFINVPAGNTSQWAFCTKFHKSTCIQCKVAYLDHPTPDVHPELISKEDKELAEREGYKQCPNSKCRKLLERIDGCDHMTCVCGTHFCYRCGRSLNYGSVDGMACNCLGQNQWIDGVQQWQNGGDSGGDGDGDEDEDDDDDETDDDDVVDDEAAEDTNLQAPMEMNIHNAIDLPRHLAVQLVTQDNAATFLEGMEAVNGTEGMEVEVTFIDGQLPWTGRMRPRAEAGAHQTQGIMPAHPQADAAEGHVETQSSDDDGEEVEADQVMSDAPAPETERQEGQHGEQSAGRDHFHVNGDTGGDSGW